MDSFPTALVGRANPGGGASPGGGAIPGGSMGFDAGAEAGAAALGAGRAIVPGGGGFPFFGICL